MTQSYAGGLDQLNSLDRILVCEHESYELSLVSFLGCILVCLSLATNDKRAPLEWSPSIVSTPGSAEDGIV